VLWFDAQVVAALEAGIEQVVVIGAGYDSRAWRLGWTRCTGHLSRGPPTFRLI
jgi:O-methyltransferase involved in polyketide biosynthesis